MTGPVNESLILPSGGVAPSEARRFIGRLLADGELRETAELLVSELVTNAVTYADGPVELTVRVAGDQTRVEVSDTTPARPVLRPPDRNGRRGLHLVEALARRWGVDCRDDGKTVWFELPAADDTR